MNFLKTTTRLAAALIMGGAIASPAAAQMQIRIIQEGPAAESAPSSQSGQTASPGESSDSTPSANVATPSVSQPEAAQPGEPPYDRFMRLGYAASEAENYQQAMTYFRRALDANPGDRLATIAYWNMVNALQSSQPADGAEAPAGEAVDPSATAGGTSADTPTFDEYMNAGYSAVKRNNYEQALGYFQRAQQIRPESPYAAQAIRNVESYIQGT